MKIPDHPVVILLGYLVVRLSDHQVVGFLGYQVVKLARYQFVRMLVKVFCGKRLCEEWGYQE